MVEAKDCVEGAGSSYSGSTREVGMLIIGEKINSSIKSVAAAIEIKDAEFIQKLAIDQVAAAAGMIDINAGVFVDNEIQFLKWLVTTVQEVVDVPL